MCLLLSRVLSLFIALAIACAQEPDAWFGGAYVRHDAVSEPISKFLNRHIDERNHDSEHMIRYHADKRSMKASPATLNPGDIVTVEWPNIATKKGQWIGVYSPSSAADDDFLDFYDLVKQDDKKRSATFNLINMRDDYEFRLWHGTGHKARLLATSNKVSFKNAQQIPMHVHIALGDNPSEIIVQWTSGSGEIPTVQIGTSSRVYQQNFTGSSRTFKASDLCDVPATVISSRLFRDPGWMSEVRVTGLQPSTRYFYRVSNNATVWSKEFSFNTAPPLGDLTAETRFIAFGDLGVTGYPGAVSTVQRSAVDIDNGSTMIVHVGDLAYAHGAMFIWEQFMNIIEPIASRAAYMVAVGNHEHDHTGSVGTPMCGDDGFGFNPTWGNYGNDSLGECSVPVVNRFHMPGNGRAPFWYSFDHGLVHILVISSEHDFTKGSEQYKFIQKDLKSVNRTVTPWLIVAGHRPMYSSIAGNPGAQQVSGVIQDSLEELFHMYSVDAALWGHSHAFERTCPMYQGTCRGTAENPDGTVHLVIGNAGYALCSEKWDDVSWSQKRLWQYGHARFVATSSTLSFEMIGNTDGTVLDSVVLHKASVSSLKESDQPAPSY
eukprot:GILK01011143.1.p1 GENE.GILK01011143.1~~GILK01011143.1.p1  ORF type:complete len:603 (-),score=67.55 GILK01011143.1:139-1947(-)